MKLRYLRPFLIAVVVALALVVTPGPATAQDRRIHREAVGSSMLTDAIDAARLSAPDRDAQRRAGRFGHDGSGRIHAQLKLSGGEQFSLARGSSASVTVGAGSGEGRLEDRVARV